MVLRTAAAAVVVAGIACDGGNTVEPPVPTAIVATTATTLTGAVSSLVSPLPSVLVTDQNAAPMAGVTVTFVVTSGGGSVSGGSVATDASGIATVGSWSLGPSAGANTLAASAASLAPVVFTATGTAAPPPPPPPPPPPACDVRTGHSIGSTTSGSLATSDCQLVDGTFVTYVDFFSATLGQSTAYLFRQSASFDTYLYLATPDLAVIGENDDENTSTNSAIKALLPAGSYVLGASSFDARVTGDYTISSTTAATAVTGCERIFVVKNVTTTQSIDPSDCLRSTPPAAPIYADAYLIVLRAGQPVTVSMTSIQVDAFIELVHVDDLVQLSGPMVASNDNRDGTTKDAELSYTAATSGYYRIVARTGVTSQTGPYTLAIQ